MLHWAKTEMCSQHIRNIGNIHSCCLWLAQLPYTLSAKAGRFFITHKPKFVQLAQPLPHLPRKPVEITVLALRIKRSQKRPQAYTLTQDTCGVQVAKQSQ
jgi:hypothetical protein